jgi:hypothetical protein
MAQAGRRGRQQELRWLGQEQEGQRAQHGAPLPALQGRSPAREQQAEAHFR